MANRTVPPLRMEVKFRNNIILRLMEARGIRTVAELCRQAQTTNSGRVGQLINMRELPLNKDGSWRSEVTQLAEFFNCLPEDMFSAEQLETKLEKNRGFAEVTFGEVHALLAARTGEDLLPERNAEQSELKSLVAKMLGTLIPRDEMIIRMRFGIGTGVAEHDRDEVAKNFGLSYECIRQVEEKAFRRLRRPSHADYLRQFLDDGHCVIEDNERIKSRFWAR